MKEEIESMIEDVVHKRGQVLVNLAVNPASGRHSGQILITIGAVSGNVSTQACSQVSKAVARELEQTGLDAYFPGKYTLEVGSPGLTRKLRTERELNFGVGRRVRVKFIGDGTFTREPLQGTLVEVQDHAVVIQTLQKDEESETDSAGDSSIINETISKESIKVVQLDLL